MSGSEARIDAGVTGAEKRSGIVDDRNVSIAENTVAAGGRGQVVAGTREARAGKRREFT